MVPCVALWWSLTMTNPLTFFIITVQFSQIFLKAEPLFYYADPRFLIPPL